MKLIYRTEKLKKQCETISEAQKLFGGDKILALGLLEKNKRSETIQGNKGYYPDAYR